MQRATTEKRGLPYDGRVPVFPVRYGTLWDDEKGESSANSGRNCRGSRKAPNQRKAPLLRLLPPPRLKMGANRYIRLRNAELCAGLSLR